MWQALATTMTLLLMANPISAWYFPRPEGRILTTSSDDLMSRRTSSENAFGQSGSREQHHEGRGLSSGSGGGSEFDGEFFPRLETFGGATGLPLAPGLNVFFVFSQGEPRDRVLGRLATREDVYFPESSGATSRNSRSRGGTVFEKSELPGGGSLDLSRRVRESGSDGFFGSSQSMAGSNSGSFFGDSRGGVRSTDPGFFGDSRRETGGGASGFFGHPEKGAQRHHEGFFSSSNRKVVGSSGGFFPDSERDRPGFFGGPREETETSRIVFLDRDTQTSGSAFEHSRRGSGSAGFFPTNGGNRQRPDDGFFPQKPEEHGGSSSPGFFGTPGRRGSSGPGFFSESSRRGRGASLHRTSSLRGGGFFGDTRRGTASQFAQFFSETEDSGLSAELSVDGTEDEVQPQSDPSETESELVEIENAEVETESSSKGGVVAAIKDLLWGISDFLGFESLRNEVDLSRLPVEGRAGREAIGGGFLSAPNGFFGISSRARSNGFRAPSLGFNGAGRVTREWPSEEPASIRRQPEPIRRQPASLRQGRESNGRRPPSDNGNKGTSTWKWPSD